MKTWHPKSSIRLLLIALGLSSSVWAQATASASKPGILILAHGGSKGWNDSVLALSAKVATQFPAEVAFGMATRANIQQGIDRLAARGATEIIAVPLFVSPYSSVVTSSEYLLRQRAEMPADLKLFARMNHGTGDAAHTPDEHGTHPVQTNLPIRMTKALGRHPIVSNILLSRAKEISKTPADEVVILVAHGPTSEAENQLWLDDMKAIAERMSGSGFHRIEYLTVRDDAPAEIRDAATKELRQVVERAKADGKRTLIVPLLLAFGGIESGIRKRLEGLDYAMTSSGLLPDDRLADWVLEMAKGQ